jgi:hypothetical protein
VSPEALQILGIPMYGGKLFGQGHDAAPSVKVAVIPRVPTIGYMEKNVNTYMENKFSRQNAGRHVYFAIEEVFWR